MKYFQSILVTLELCVFSGLVEAERSDIRARISIPYENSLVRANVPVFGVADARDFKSYRLEFGPGEEPEEWTLIRSSAVAEREDPSASGKVNWNPDWGAEGNLGTWQTGLTNYPYRQKWKHQLLGPYTLRLVVEDKKGRTAETRVHVDVAQVITNVLGGKATSVDGKVQVAVPAEAITGTAVLISIRSSKKKLPSEGLVNVGGIYEWRPPGLEFTRPVSLSFSWKAKSPAGAKAVESGKPGPAPKAWKNVSSKEAQAGGLKAGAVGVYAFDFEHGNFRRLKSEVDQEKGVIRAAITKAPLHAAFFGLFADLQAPAVPRVSTLPDTVQSRRLPLKGEAEPFSKVVASINRREQSFEVDGEGHFAGVVKLDPGRNTIRLLARDGAGNSSTLTKPFLVRLAYLAPKSMRSLEFLGPEGPTRGNKLLVRLEGTDADSARVDRVPARVWSSASDPKGFEIELEETGPATGKYVAMIELSKRTEPARNRLAVGHAGEAILAACSLNPSLRATRQYVDQVPPGAPVITCRERPFWCWDTFEPVEGAGKGRWSGWNGENGAVPEIQAAYGQHFLRMRPAHPNRSQMGILRSLKPFKVNDFPILSFDYRIDPGGQVDLVFHLESGESGWYGIELTDRDPYYPRLGSFDGAQGDGQWRHAEINLRNVLRKRFYPLEDFTISAIGFIDLDGGNRIYLSRSFGLSGRNGGSYSIDNFAVMRHLSKGVFNLEWKAEDENGISGSSYELDQKAGAIPDQKAEAPGNAVSYKDLKDGRWWFHVRARDQQGNWGPANHYLLVVDEKPPVAEAPDLKKPWGMGEPLSIRLRDTASGVEPYSIRLEVDFREYTIRDKALAYDPESGLLTFSPREVRPYAVVFAQGQQVPFRLMARDRSGHAMGGPLEFKVRAVSPLLVRPVEPPLPNGWYKSSPRVKLAPEAKKQWDLRWKIRRAKGAPKTYSSHQFKTIREILLLPKKEDAPIFAKRLRIDPKKVATGIKVTGRRKDSKTWWAPVEVELEHGSYALVPGGLLGHYFKTADFKEKLLDRIDPFLYFWDKRERSTPMVRGAQSARWEGALKVDEAREAELELAVWFGAPAKATLWLDGEKLLEYPPAEDKQAGFVKRKVILTEGMHPLRLDFSDPQRAQWSLMLFEWGRGKGFRENVRKPLGPEVLYFPRGLAQTYYALNDRPYELYRGPVKIPPGVQALRFYSETESGRREKTRLEILRVEAPAP